MTFPTSCCSIPGNSRPEWRPSSPSCCQLHMPFVHPPWHPPQQSSYSPATTGGFFSGLHRWNGKHRRLENQKLHDSWPKLYNILWFYSSSHQDCHLSAWSDFCGHLFIQLSLSSTLEAGLFFRDRRICSTPEIIFYYINIHFHHMYSNVAHSIRMPRFLTTPGKIGVTGHKQK